MRNWGNVDSHEARINYRRALSIILVLVGVLLLGFFQTRNAGAQTFLPTATPSANSPAATATLPPFDASRLARPIVPSQPSQADQGSLIYWGVCMACHGDRGQGLTNEWRGAAFGPDANCWKSRCHGKDHPPEGFEIPKDKFIPALTAPGSLARFLTAQDMHDFILANMPWWNPGSLTSDKAWQVTAYILKVKGVLPANIVLSEQNASEIFVREMAPPPDDHIAEIVLAATLLLSSLGLALQFAWPRLQPASNPDPAAGAPTISRPKRPNFFAHLHPPTIPAAQARWRYTLGAGGIAVFLCLVLVVTGLLEMFYYMPSPDQAANSIQTITFLVPFGSFVRNLHYWAAQALVVVAVIHLLRVIFTGAFSSPRRFNYLLGLGLLIIILFFDFTGYVLRWDEGIRWALVAGTNLIKSIPALGESLFLFVVGGSTIGPAALVRFYTWHIYALGIIGAVILIWHLFRVRRDGGIAAPPNRLPLKTDRIDRSELLRREVLAMLIAGVVLVLLSAFLRAPIALPIRDNVIQLTDARAPWFFLWVQQLLKLGNPFLLGVVVPLLVVLILVLIPYVFPQLNETERGRWFPRKGRAAQILVTAIFLTLIILTILGYTSVINP